MPGWRRKHEPATVDGVALLTGRAGCAFKVSGWCVLRAKIKIRGSVHRILFSFGEVRGLWCGLTKQERKVEVYDKIYLFFYGDYRDFRLFALPMDHAE